MTRIRISFDRIVLEAELIDSSLATRFAASLPLEIAMSRWGDEYYGACGLADSGVPGGAEADEAAKEVMEIGELAFWPPGDAFCVFFGPTPASTDSRPRAVSPVLPLGRLYGEADRLAHLPAAITARIELS